MADSFTYSGDPSTSPRDEVRFMLQDTDPAMPLLSDAEIAWLLDQWMPRYDSTIYVAAAGADVIARKFAGVVSVTADGVTVNTADLSQRYQALAAQLRAEYANAQIGGEVDISNLMLDYQPDLSIRPLNFGLGMHDNPEAGQQDFGGEWPGIVRRES